MVIVLFGPPGVGKTYLGKLVEARCGVKFLDTDDLYSPEEIVLIREKRFDDPAKKKFTAKVINKIKAMSSSQNEVILVAGAFTRDQSRKNLIREFSPNIKFVRVKADRKIGMRRAKDRLKESTHIITEDIIDRQWNLFEEPSFVYQVIMNENMHDDENLLAQFKSLL